MNAKKRFLQILSSVVVCLGLVASAGAVVPYGTYTESFDSGYTLGAQLRTHPDWFYESGNSGPVPTAGAGVNSTVGLSKGDRIFTWVACPFDWNDPGFTDINLKIVAQPFSDLRLVLAGGLFLPNEAVMTTGNKNVDYQFTLQGVLRF